MNISDDELKTLLRSNRAFLQNHNELIKSLEAKIAHLTTECNIFQTLMIQIKSNQKDWSEFQKSLNRICNTIQSEEAKERLGK